MKWSLPWSAIDQSSEIAELRAEVERLRKSRHEARYQRSEAERLAAEASTAARLAGEVNAELRAERDRLAACLESMRADVGRIRRLASDVGLFAATTLGRSGVGALAGSGTGPVNDGRLDPEGVRDLADHVDPGAGLAAQPAVDRVAADPGCGGQPADGDASVAEQVAER